MTSAAYVWAPPAIFGSRTIVVARTFNARYAALDQPELIDVVPFHKFLSGHHLRVYIDQRLEELIVGALHDLQPLALRDSQFTFPVRSHLIAQFLERRREIHQDGPAADVVL